VGWELSKKRLRAVRKGEMTAGLHATEPAGLAPAELAGLAFFESMPGWALQRLARSAMRRQLEQGAMVVRQNDEARSVHFLLSGAVQILVYFEEVGDLLVGVQRDKGTLIGWSAFTAPYRYTSSVRCEEASKLLRIPRETFDGIFEEDAYLGYEILKKVATTVDTRLEGAVTFLDSPIMPAEL
jgi:CRP-like cAMP-binding protein